VFPSRQHETDGPQATGEFLSGINRRDRMRMKPRGARCGRHEHDDSPHEAVKHAVSEARQMPLRKPPTNGDFSAFANCCDYHLVRPETMLLLAPP
jgi:hypothetical protein